MSKRKDQHYRVTLTDIYGLFNTWCVTSFLTISQLTDKLSSELTAGTTLTVELEG